VRSGTTVDWLPGVPAAHPASPAAAQHVRTAAREILLAARKSRSPPDNHRTRR